MRIETATPGDAGQARAVAALAYAPYLARMDRRPAPMDADFEAAVLDGTLRVLCMGDELGGYIVSFAQGQEWQIENLAIAPKFQGTGLGARLLAEAERLASDAGCTALTLYTNVVMIEAIGFYTRAGFVQTGRRRDHGFDRAYFRRALRY